MNRPNNFKNNTSNNNSNNNNMRKKYGYSDSRVENRDVRQENRPRPHHHTSRQNQKYDQEQVCSIGSALYRKAQMSRDKFLDLAKDAYNSGDRITSEYWNQHAEHYSRVIHGAHELAAEQAKRVQARENAARTKAAGETAITSTDIEQNAEGKTITTPADITQDLKENSLQDVQDVQS